MRINEKKTGTQAIEELKKASPRSMRSFLFMKSRCRKQKAENLQAFRLC